MRRLFLLTIVGAMLGCKTTTTTPFEHRPTMRVDDPVLATNEQMRRGRDRLALPDPDGTVLPRTYAEFPDPFGR
jgi:hypothetical protein